jgi:hypothetical protein
VLAIKRTACSAHQERRTARLRHARPVTFRSPVMRDFVLISLEPCVADSSSCSAVGVFAAPQNPSTDKEPSTLRARQARAHRVTQLRRFRARSERRGRVLLCRDAFGSYCGAGSIPKVPALACWSVRATADDKIGEKGAQARRVSHLGSNVCLSLTSPLLRIGDPSPYATRGGPSVDPTVLHVLRSYPLTRATRYQPKHALGHLVATNTSLAGAQTTPPKHSCQAPSIRNFKNPPIPALLHVYQPLRTSQPFVKPASRRNHAPDNVRPETKKSTPKPNPQKESHHPPNPKQHHRGEPSSTGDPLGGRV